jgi:hypothetical protein
MKMAGRSLTLTQGMMLSLAHRIATVLELSFVPSMRGRGAL